MNAAWTTPRVVTIHVTRIGGLLVGIAAVSLLHAAATNRTELVWHGLLLRLYYLPILLAAYWYGAFGGLLTALTCSAAYAPHLREQSAVFEAGRYAEIVVFHLIGLTVGLLASAQRRVTERYQAAVVTLEVANRKLAESYDQLSRADRLKTLGEVASGLAHEIRHPLASIGGALEIIAERSQPDSPEREFSRLALDEVERLNHLVWEFLRYARPHDPELRHTPLGSLVERVFALLEFEAERSSVSLAHTSLSSMPDVPIDAQQIEQVLLNVVLNAVQASPPGSCVHVCEQVDNDNVCVDVIDQGPGIPPQDRLRIFDPFFTTREKGTGLGLAIALRIVSNHHGTLTVRESSERGTCVRLMLPVVAPVQPCDRAACQVET